MVLLNLLLCKVFISLPHQHYSINSRTSPIPPTAILAGGLRPENVARAITEVRPAAVDAHTGVEGLNGRKDLQLVRAFVEQARAAFTN